MEREIRERETEKEVHHRRRNHISLQRRSLAVKLRRRREVGREEDLAWVVYARSERRGRERQRTWSEVEEKMGALSALSALSSLISPCERTTTLLLLV